MRAILARMWARRPGRGLREWKAYLAAQSAELDARWDKWVTSFRWTQTEEIPQFAQGTRNPARPPSGRLPGSLNAPKRKPQFIPIDLDESMRMLQIEADALIAAIRTGQPF